MMHHFKIIATILILLALPGCDLQDAMLYYPSFSRPSPEFLSARHLRYWPADDTDYRGFISTIPNDHANGTIIVFHGNAGTAAERYYYVETLAPLGYRVILAEYPGYGARTGKPGEASFVNDARAVLRLAFEQSEKPVFLLGESLGCGVAAAVVNDTTVPIAGIILITPWDTLLSVAKGKLPWLPVRLFLRDTYDTVGNLRLFQKPVAVIGAGHDEVIPVRHAQELYRSLSGTKKMWMITGAGHNDWPDRMDPSWWREIMEFTRGKNSEGRK
jgi:pimeloyl-ACP methyl ester carboxylesterase